MNTLFKAQPNMAGWIAKVAVRLFGSFFLLMAMGAQAQIVQYEGMTDPGFGWSRSWVDINNDGKDDYCVMTGDVAQNLDCYLSTGTTFGPMQRYNLGSGKDPKGFQWADIDGDGQIDFCRTAKDYNAHTQILTCWLGPTFTVARTTAALPTGWSETVLDTNTYTWKWIYHPGLNDNWYLVDVNGDGRADYCYLYQNDQNNTNVDVRCMLANGGASGFSTAAAPWIRAAIAPGADDWPRGFYDFNADGYPDFCRVLSSKQLRCALGGPNGFTTTEVTSNVIDAPIKEGAAFVDVNGDGNVDFCRLTGASAAQMPLGCVMSNGLAWETTERSSPPLYTGAAENRFWFDINGDGLPDYCRNVNGAFTCRLSRGDGDGNSLYAFGFTDVSVANVNFGTSDGGQALCDAAGTGQQSFCRLYGRTVAAGQVCYEGEWGQQCYDTQANVFGLIAGLVNPSPSSGDLSLQARPSLLTSYSDGIGAETRISYLPMTSSSVYTRSGVGTYSNPRALISLPRSQVVYETRAWQAGTQNALTGLARYFYKDLRSDPLAGSRGFRERWIFTEASNTLDHVVYFQGLGPTVDASSVMDDRREIGLTKYQERFAVANGLLPAPSNVGTPRQGYLSAVTSAAMRLSAVSDAAPSTQSPFILLQSTTNTLSDTVPANSRYKFIGASSVKSWDWDGSSRIWMPQVDTSTVMTNLGNVTSLVQTTTAPNGLVWRKTTTNTYDADNTSLWILGRLTKAVVKSEAPTADAQLAAYTRSAGNSANASAISSSAPAVPQPISPAVLSSILQLLLDD